MQVGRKSGACTRPATLSSLLLLSVELVLALLRARIPLGALFCRQHPADLVVLLLPDRLGARAELLHLVPNTCTSGRAGVTLLERRAEALRWVLFCSRRVWY